MTAFREVGGRPDCTLRVRESPDGLVVTLWRKEPKRSRRRAARPPADADLVVFSMRRDVVEPRKWSATVRHLGDLRQVSRKVCSPNPTIGRVQMLAWLVENYAPTTVAVRNGRLLRSLLRDGVRVRQVDLARAVARLRRLLKGRSVGWSVLPRTAP